MIADDAIRFPKNVGAKLQLPLSGLSKYIATSHQRKLTIRLYNYYLHRLRHYSANGCVC